MDAGGEGLRQCGRIPLTAWWRVGLGRRRLGKHRRILVISLCGGQRAIWRSRFTYLVCPRRQTLVSQCFYPLSHPPPYSAVLNQCLWVEEMAQRVNGLPCKPSDMSSISDPHKGGRKSQFHNIVFRPSHAVACLSLHASYTVMISKKTRVCK